MIVAGVIAVAVLDLNAFKPKIEAAVLNATGRAIQMNGPLRIGWSLEPTIEASDVTLANLPGGSRPDIARVERIQARLSVTALFRREIEVTRLTLIGPDILFEQIGSKPNWIWAAPHSPEGSPAQANPTPRPNPEAGSSSDSSPTWSLRIRNVQIQNGMLTWRVPSYTKVIGVRTLQLTSPVDGGPVDVSAVLVYSDFEPFDIQLAAQPSGGLRDPWTAKLRIKAFDTTATAAGTFDLDGPFDLQVDGTSGALEKLNALLPDMRLPLLHGMTLSTHIRNGPTLGDLPIIGATQLHFGSADLTAPSLFGSVAGLVLGATKVSLLAEGGSATIASSGRFAGQALSLAGTVGVPRQPDGKRSIPIDLKAEAGPGSLALKGSVALDALRFRGLDAVATLRSPALAALRPLLSPSLPALTNVRFDGHITVPGDGSALAVKGGKLVAAEGDVAGDWTLGLKSALSVEGKLASSRLDLDAMLAAFGVALPAAPAMAGARGPAISTAPLDWARLRGPKVNLTAQIAEMPFQGEVWRNVGFALRLEGGRMVAGPVTVSLPQGPLRMSFNVDASGNGIPVAVDLHAPGIPLALVARYAGLPGPMEGFVRIEANLHGVGSSPHDIAASLGGPISAILTGGRMTNAAFTMLTSASLEALSIRVPPQGETALHCLGLVGSFERGVGRFRTIALDTTYLKLDGTGTVDFGSETVAFKLRPMTEIAGSQVAVPVVVEGPFHDVHGRLDATGLDKLGLFIDGLFGGERSTACADAGLAAPTAATDKP